MTIPGGLPEPRPDQQFAPTGAPMAPGSQTPVVRANKVIIFGPSGVVVGLFVYATGTTPGPGNPPVDSITRSPTDPFSNAVQPDFVAYGTGGAFAQLTAGLLNFKGTASQSSPAVIQTLNTAGFLDLLSGLVSGGDTAAEFILQSAQASGVAQAQAIINAAAFIVNAAATINGNTQVAAAQLSVGNGATANIVLNPKIATPPNLAAVVAGTATLAQTEACLGALVQSFQNRQIVN